MKVFRTGIVGTGFVGQIHVETVRRLGNVEVVALTDKFSAEESAKKLNIPKYFTDYKEMIDTMNLDVVHICTPNNTHFEIAMYALEHGVNVICEKPMTTTIEQAEALVKKAKETGLVAAINFHNRFYPMTHHLKNIIADGELGDIFSISGSYMQDWLLFETDYSWRLNTSESGATRVIADIGSHWMDLAEYVTGLKITEVCADFSTIHKTRKKPKKNVLAFSTEKFNPDDYEDIPINTEDNASVMFRFSNGAKGSAFFSQVIAGKSVAIDLVVGGYKKSAEWNSEKCNCLLVGNRDSYNQVFEKGFATVHPDTIPIVGYPFGHLEGFADAFKQCFTQVYNSIENPNAKKDYATFEDGLHEMILCDRIFESNQKQQWVKI
ncbi:Gfo/Idh/MocA family oxidoreductase [[Clostridium] cellulosi]|jgi:Oxidoreductase family, C-terminal alpha/beta domain./Oxidoreductase family, NAD-binding Rossmann fold.